MDDEQAPEAREKRNVARPLRGYARLERWWFTETDRWFWLILALAFVIRLAYGLPVSLGPPLTGRPFLIDEQEYYAAGQMLAAGHGFAFYDTFAWTRAPLYPLLVGGVFRLAGPNPGLVLGLQALLSTITLYWLATRAGRIAVRQGESIMGFRAARRGVALIGGLWLSFTLFSQLLVSETLFLFLFVAVLVVLARWAEARAGWRPLLLAGVLLGLAALTRSTALAFVPLAAAWAGWLARGGLGVGGWGLESASAAVSTTDPKSKIQNPKSKILRAAGALLAGAVLVIAPWTARNIVAYGWSPGGPVIIDTASGYNLWLAANGVHDAERLAQELRGIDGVLTRQAHAFAQARDLIAADPGAFLAKGVKEAGDLWTINFTAEERQVGGYTAGRVPGAHLLALATLEDGWYLLLVPLALLGMAVTPPDPLKALVGLWAALWVVMAFVFFAVTRFRFPVVACLLPWAPVGLAWLVRRGWRTTPVRGGHWALVALAGLFVLGVGPSAAGAARNAALGLARWNEQAPFREGERILAQQGRPDNALAAYAQANQQIADTRFGILAAQIQQAANDPAQLATVARSPYLDLSPTGIYNNRLEAYILLGQIARLRGDLGQAARLFTDRAVSDATPEALAWARDHLGQVDAFAPHVDVGSGLDVGFVEGMYPPEREGNVTYRWTTATATLWPPDPVQSTGLRLRVNGWRPSGWPPAQVVVHEQHCGVDTCFERDTLLTLPNDTAWHEIDLDLSPRRLVLLELRSTTFIPGGADPRPLGIKIDWVEWQ